MPNAPCPVVSRLTVSRLPRGHVFGYPCDAASAAAYGRLPEWPKGTVCKTVASASVGSNPTPATTSENGPLAAETRLGGPFSSVGRVDVSRPAASLGTISETARTGSESPVIAARGRVGKSELCCSVERLWPARPHADHRQ